MPEIALPPLNDLKHLDADQIASFRKNGHVLIPSVLDTDEVALYRDVINKAAYAYNTENRSMEERDTYGKAFLQIMNLWEVDEDVKQFTLARRFAKIAADLLGVDQVRLYHDQALYKEAGGGFTPWHQDQYYWPLSTNNTVTMWMPLIDVEEDMGMLTFASGSHTEGSVKNVAISDESEAELNDYIKTKGYPVTRPKTMKAGDASFHYGWTLHAAPGNLSNVTREVMTIIYYADPATVTTPINQHQENDRNRWLDGIVPGQPAASKLNPALV
jgi:ectoine hydroxylase-related dioxygenase (phytanoyl-CoA dioxygenase family)